MRRTGPLRAYDCPDPVRCRRLLRHMSPCTQVLTLDGRGYVVLSGRPVPEERLVCGSRASSV